MITAAITAAVAAVLALFGIKPGPYLIVVAAVVKGVIILGAVLLGRKLLKTREGEKPAAPPPEV
jgi:hypothetical protein